MTQEEFRKSLYRQELDAFLNSPSGVEYLNQLVSSITPKAVDPQSPVTAWVAAHERLVGAQEIIQLTIDLSRPPVIPPEEQKADWGVAPSQLPAE